VKALWIIYLTITVAQTLSLLVVGVPLFDAVSTAFSTIASGGYSPRNASVAHYASPVVDWIVTIFMVVTGVNFGLYFMVWRGRGRRALSDTELRVYLGILAVSSLLVALDLMINAGYTAPADALRYGAFQIVSQQTGTASSPRTSTAGPVLQVADPAGDVHRGCSGSTCGGLKVIRLIILAKYARRQLYSTFQPRLVVPMKLSAE